MNVTISIAVFFSILSVYTIDCLCYSLTTNYVRFPLPTICIFNGKEVDVLRKRHGRIRKINNILVFPGTYERLLQRGVAAVDKLDYEEAVIAFEQAYMINQEATEFLGQYAIALYETKQFALAKEITQQLLQSGAAQYFDAMELYLTILIQLQEYEEVEKTIQTLMDEGIIPEEARPRFIYLRDLSGRLSKRYGEHQPLPNSLPFTLDQFTNWPQSRQQLALASLEGTDVTVVKPILIQIAENSSMAPLVITFALTLLQQAKVEDEVYVQKMGKQGSVSPHALPLPGMDEQTLTILEMIEDKYEKDPSRLQFVKGLIRKYALTMFPFNWGVYTSEEIVEAYNHYIQHLFTEEPLPNTALINLILEIEQTQEGE